MPIQRRSKSPSSPATAPGPEVTAEGLKVLKAVAELEKFSLRTDSTSISAASAICAPAKCCPAGAVDELRKFDAIYLGAVGHPDVPPGILEKGLLLELRFQLDQYINLRPVKLFPGVETPLKDKGPEDIDFVVVRENTEDLYCGVGGFLKKGTPDEVASQTAVYTRKGCERCIRWAFEFTRKRNNPKKDAHAGGQDQRADLRPRPVVADVPGSGQASIPTSRPTTTTSTPAACGW